MLIMVRLRVTRGGWGVRGGGGGSVCVSFFIVAAPVSMCTPFKK